MRPNPDLAGLYDPNIRLNNYNTVVDSSNNLKLPQSAGVDDDELEANYYDPQFDDPAKDLQALANNESIQKIYN